MSTKSTRKPPARTSTTAKPLAAVTPLSRSAPNAAKVAAQLKEAVDLQQSGDLAGAEKLFRAVLALQPTNWAACYSMASICSGRGDWAAAREHAQTGLMGNPGHAKLTEALAHIDRALAQPSASAAPSGELNWNDLMQVVRHCEGLGAQGRNDEAMAVYRQFLAHHTGGLQYVGLFNLSVLQAQAGQKVEAEASMRQAILVKPDFFAAHMNLGTHLEGLGRQEEAVEVWKAALAMPEVQKPENLDVHVQLCNNLGRLLEIMRRYDEAEEALARSLKVKPGQTPAISHWLHLRQKMCKWPAWHGLGMSKDEVLQHASALGMMALSDDPQQQLDCARRFVKEKVGVFDRMVPKGHRYGHDRIRIGFLSSDLSMHAVSLLTVEMFEKFDRSKVEVHAFCWSKEDGTAFRERVRAAFDVFHKIGELTDEQAAQLIVDNEIDVVFDLQGITAGARPNIVARGPAPMQIAYLGYVGTSALPHVDYVIADKFIFPEELKPYFTEEPLYLPCFQVSDSQRVMGPKPTRAQYGLPEDAFVYCAFNNNYKITPEVFESWMRILRRVPHGVLWLLEDNPWSRENLTKAAMAHGVEPHRLHFTGRIDPKDYLARFTIADLFLDTHPYGAGTTANDALWAGLPVLTMPGRTYASRMAGALLKAAQKPQWIAADANHYEETAVLLASTEKTSGDHNVALQHLLAGTIVFDTKAACASIEDKITQLSNHSTLYSRNEDLEIQKKPITRNRRFRLLVRGWRGINHSYALVNQYQLAELARNPEIELFHEDMPMLANWKAAPDGAGLAEEYRELIKKIPDYDGRRVDATYTITSPHTLWQGRADYSYTFLVTEFGPDSKSWGPNHPSAYTQGSRYVITPSHWSKRKLIEAGLHAERIAVIPHGVDKSTFKPMLEHDRQAIRSRLGLLPQHFALLNVGGAFWNKGVDLLVRAFAELSQEHKNLRLILKDNRGLYGLTSDGIVADLKAQYPELIDQTVIGRIITVPGTLTAMELAKLYNAADLYVSPYRAEGFNLPVIEAMACGLRALVTEGGATDDFFLDTCGRKLPSTLVSPQQCKIPVAGDFLEPDFDCLLSAINQEILSPGHKKCHDAINGWDAVTKDLLRFVVERNQNV